MVRDLCAATITFLKKKLLSQEFISRHKQNLADFTRKRSLPFHILFTFLINLIKSSLQNELAMFFKQIHHTDIPQRKVTASALSQARHKLKHQAFIELNHETTKHFYDTYSPKTWHGFHLIAIDGSTVKVPQNSTCKEYFGTLPVRQAEPRALARVSHCFDVLNHITRDALIDSLHIGERDFVVRHCAHLTPKDLILLDRGYPAYWLFRFLREKGIHFCARLSIGKWNIAKQFLTSGLSQQNIQLDPIADSQEKCRELSLSLKPIQLRLIRIHLEGAQEPIVLITTLTDSDFYPYELFHDLYFQRWPIEENYKVLKCRIEIENFSGKSVETVLQDFHANIFMRNITAILAFPVHSHIEMDAQEKELDYKINWTQALAKMRNCGIVLFFRKHILSLIKKLHKLFIENNSAIRKGRKFPRNVQPRKKIFAFPYKPIS
ncbi:MAG: IS4 family transposase [Candidatus Jettenia sp.]|uniref:Putative transposase n=1 Tax=Candidatus Jettenia caeni TaxID=247490 RepID=I3IHP0_9BACT|nr:IS4 family transposase [Candidatus Jettenia sp. AMX1]MBC6928497.1 IS4 family transposase [Candidatus Jettenia sp.]NUN23168.1 IS4 family transposase [Candidatus Jettenia caeni]KAA0251655.1 MAG: IS4 family transposase [Candidatus Jettenia sp. AMX1]MCE7879827.1 IS4 family transposase [Candidatus Jettenia sp. AMX1]MCQ3925893.1 IS4 family transposase [Candidatus Jettenia sp.]